MPDREWRRPSTSIRRNRVRDPSDTAVAVGVADHGVAVAVAVVVAVAVGAVADHDSVDENDGDCVVLPYGCDRLVL